MATAQPPNHDPTLAHVAPSQQSSAAGAQQTTGEVPSLSGLGSEQVMALLKQLPGINFPRVSVPYPAMLMIVVHLFANDRRRAYEANARRVGYT